MKKIFIFAGVVLFFILILTTWLFIVDFSDFAKFLGKEVKESSNDEKSKFIGTWKTVFIEGDERFVGYNGIYKFSSDGSGTIGGLTCSWVLTENKLVVDYFEGSQPLIYDYIFSENYELLTLNNSKGSLVFSKFIN